MRRWPVRVLARAVGVAGALGGLIADPAAAQWSAAPPAASPAVWQPVASFAVGGGSPAVLSATVGALDVRVSLPGTLNGVVELPSGSTATVYRAAPSAVAAAGDAVGSVGVGFSSPTDENPTGLLPNAVTTVVAGPGIGGSTVPWFTAAYGFVPAQLIAAGGPAITVSGGWWSGPAPVTGAGDSVYAFGHGYLNLRRGTEPLGEGYREIVDVAAGAATVYSSGPFGLVLGRAVAPGYRLATAGGRVLSFGAATALGDAAGYRLNAPIVGYAPYPDGNGYWLVAVDGGVFSFGSAPFFGSMGGVRLSAPIVGLAATSTGAGYWLVGADGAEYTFGDAAYQHGFDPGSGPAVGLAGDPDRSGVWILSRGGGVYTGGRAPFFGAPASIPPAAPAVGIAATPDGRGYWVASADGGVYAYGDARFFGSAATYHLAGPVVAIYATPDGGGYRLVAADGGVFCFGDAVFTGSAAPLRPPGPVVG